MEPEGTQEALTLEAVLERNNVYAAWLVVKANHGAPGVDGMTVEESTEHLRLHWEKIADKLRSVTYRPAAVRAVKIPKGDGKSRTLGIPTVVDRCIQEAIHLVLSPAWEKDFSEYSYGFRPKRSAHDAVRQAQSYIGEGKTWVVNIDLKSFFDEVSHDKLMHQVSQKVRDKRLLKLIGMYLRAPMQEGKEKGPKRTKGTPQGGPLSPLLANIYLDPLDKELERRGVSFVRYADDISIYVSSERSAERVYESIVQWLRKELKVEVNGAKSGARRCDENHLLGFCVYPSGEIGVSPKAIEELKDRVRELWRARQNRTSAELRDQWQRYIGGWWSYFKLATWRREVTNLSGWIRRHMRKCFWLRWRTRKGRYNALKRLGINRRALGIAGTRLGAWAMSRHRVLHAALRNRTLARYGFRIPWDPAETS